MDFACRRGVEVNVRRVVRDGCDGRKRGMMGWVRIGPQLSTEVVAVLPDRCRGAPRRV